MVFSIKTYTIFQSRVKQERYKYFFRLFLIGAILIIVSSIRMNTGSDYRNYWVIYNWSEYYQNIENIIRMHSLQSGLYILAFKLKAFVSTVYTGDGVLEQNLLHILVSIFTTIVTLYQIKKHSKNVKISVSLYLFLGYYLIANNLLKQQIAMSIFMIAVQFFIKKKYVPYILLCIMASIFHTTVLFPAILVPIFAKKQFGKRDFFIILIILTGVSFGIPIVARFMPKLSILGISIKYFANAGYFASGWRKMIFVVGVFAFYAWIYRMISKHKYEIGEEWGEISFYLNLLTVGLAINAFAIDYWLIVRFSYYFYQFIIILLPNALDKISLSKARRNNLKIIVVIYAMFFVVFSGDNTYYAYHTVFHKNMTPMVLDEYIRVYE